MATDPWRSARRPAKNRSTGEKVLAECNRLADGDFDDPPRSPQGLRRKLRVTVVGVAFCLLTLEILLTRMVPFFLGGISGFVAIPIAMFGLSLGALTLHWVRDEARLRWIPVLVPLLFILTVVTLLTFFGLFNHVFDLSHYGKQNPWTDAPKTAALTLIFVPVFAIGGVILSTAFTVSARSIGRLYAADLVGSAAACLAAPLLLQLLDLPLVLCVLLGVLGACWVYVWSAGRKAVGTGLVVGLTVTALLAGFQLVFTERPDARLLARNYAKGLDAEEVRHRWNAISRVSLIHLLEGDKGKGWRLVHDDGISNVYLRRYKPERVEQPPEEQSPQRIPSLMDRPPSSALVMFAGCGKDMVLINEFARGGASITGVELNPLVRRLVSNPWSDRWNLRTFYALPHIDLRIQEGRSFLDREPRRFDAIFVATNGAQYASRTGHSRKYLDTEEAMAAYLDHLADDGVMVFNHQAFRHKVEIFKRLQEERSSVPFDETIMILNVRKRRFRGDGLNKPVTVVVKPSGLTRGEVSRIAATWTSQPGRKVYYAPGREPYSALADLIHAPADPTAFVPVDDQPYEARVDVAGFRLLPGKDELDRISYALSWIKIFTTLLCGGLAVLTLAAFYARGRGVSGRPRRLPAWLTAYFMVTGVAYMFVQIGLMAKLELFLGNPVYSVAVVLAAYLLSNGLGSAWVDRCRRRGAPPPLTAVSGLACAATLGSMGLVEFGTGHLLAWPLVLKVPLTLAALFPLGFVLGMFYPLGVMMTSRHAQPALVPKTFGLATLSSVLGSTWAIGAVINHGFRSVIEHAAVGYGVLFVAAAIPALVVGARRAPAGERALAPTGVTEP